MLGSMAKLCFFALRRILCEERKNAQLQELYLRSVTGDSTEGIRLTRSGEDKALVKDKHLTVFSEKPDLLQLISPCP